MNEHDATAVMPHLRDIELIRRDPWGEDDRYPSYPFHHPPPETPAVDPRRVGVLPWLIPGLVMAVLGAIGMTWPALWTDELATWGMTTSSWRDMFALLRSVDAIIGPYYVLVHGWTDIAGTSDMALRLPSMIAMSGAAMLAGALGARLTDRRAGLTAGLIFAVLPSTSRFAQEARVYALVTFFAMLATYLLVRVLARPGFRGYLSYGLAVALLGLLHPIALLLLAVHGWVVLAQHRYELVAWAAAAVLGSLPALPLLWLGNQQKAQVAWIPPPTQGLLNYPDELFGVAAIGGLLVALSLFSLPLRRPSATYTAWALLPILCLFLASQVTPLFLSRYLLFTLPAWALLAGVTLHRTHVAVAVTVVAVLAVLAVPRQVAIRDEAGHGEASRGVAGQITAGFRPGDGVVYGSADPGGEWVARDLVARYVPPHRRPDDVLMTQPQRRAGQLAAAECPDPAVCLGRTPRIWIVRLGRHPDPIRGLGERKEAAVRQRYRTDDTWHFAGFTLGLVVVKQDTPGREKTS